ncbi:MAG TPA: transposase, partial [Rubrivivax sp.]|nr:transposase [Rubrivivax sp.]
MARLPRLALGGHVHYVIQRGHGGCAVFNDEIDRAAFRAALSEAAATERVQVHACALLPTEVQLLVTPAEPAALSRLMQAVGRRYVGAYNRRHGRRGTLWDGRFHCGVVEPGPLRLQAQCLIDGAAAEPGATSAPHRSGGPRDALLSDPPEYWQLGNTPFEREAAYRRLLDAGVDAVAAAQLRDAALGGWAAGSTAFRAGLAAAAARPMQPRPRGRPRRA